MTQRMLADWLVHAERLHPVGIDMGLRRVRQVAMRLDVLPPAPRTVVVAGTNGKGSTSVYLESLLQSSGFSVGTTLSPHLARFNERVRLNGGPVEDAALCEAFEIIEAARGDTTLTYFEWGILAALVVFRRASVDVCVLEVGLGGRLDAVNIVDGTVTVITSIGIDHVGYLGPDRESIGAEKAGILRPGVPCVYGESAIPDSIVDIARRLDVPLLQYGVDFESRVGCGGWTFFGRSNSRSVTIDELTHPAVALRNAATALQALLVLEPAAAVRERVAAAAEARLPGRFERFDFRGRSVIVDVAHNPHGAAFLSVQLKSQPCPGRTIAVAGFLQDKDAAGIVAALDSTVDEWMFVATGGERGQTAALSASKAGKANHAMVSEADLVRVIDEVIPRLTVGDRLVVLGSFDVAQRARLIMTGGGDHG